MPSGRRFPPPWTIEDNAACFNVKDTNGLALAYVYCEDEAGRRSAAQLLTSDEARRIAANIATAGAADTSIANPKTGQQVYCLADLPPPPKLRRLTRVSRS